MKTMASSDLPEEWLEQQEEGTGHATHKPALVAGGLATPVGTETATSSRRVPQPLKFSTEERSNLPEPFHRDASMPRFDNLEIQGTPRDDCSPPAYPVPGRTSSSEVSDESLPASPVNEKVLKFWEKQQRRKEKLAAEKQRHSETKEKLTAEELSHSETKEKLTAEELSHSETKEKLTAEELSHSDTKAHLEVERRNSESMLQYIKWLEGAVAHFRDEAHKFSQMLQDSQEDKHQLEIRLESLMQAYKSLVQKVGAEDILSKVLQGIDSEESVDHLLVMFIANALQAHFQELRCWGCFQRIDKRISSHPYGEAVLKAAAVFSLTTPESEEKVKNKVKTQQLFWLHGKPRSAATCVLPVLRECLCKSCDNSTSDWENTLAAQFGNEHIMLTFNGLCEEITELVLLMQVFRGAMMSIDLQHMRTCPNCRSYFFHILMTLHHLAEVHHTVCIQFRGPRREDYMLGVREKCRELGTIIFYSTEYTHDHLIEYPLVAVVPAIGPVIYAQIPPYYIAIPAFREHSADIGHDLMTKIISGVNRELHYIRHPRFYKDTEGPKKCAKKWKDDLIKDHCRPMLVFPCPNMCCIQI